MPECELRECENVEEELVYVNENIGDGSWRVGICRACAKRLGIKAGGDLPTTPPSKEVKK